MSRDDWYRNSSWSKSVADHFEAKLKRARAKDQYLRIQALSLLPAHPDVTLALLDRYFRLGDNLVDSASAYETQADAYLALDREQDAIASYEAALRQEQRRPNMRTWVCVNYPYLVATRSLSAHYTRALEVLARHNNDLAFPVVRFKWHGARALILSAQGDLIAARNEAKEALAAAAERQSEFRYHRGLGLVADHHAAIIKRLENVRDT